MAKKLSARVMIMLMVFACIQSWHSPQRASALGMVAKVTKENQAELELEFTLIAVRVDKQAVLVRMEIPQKGKLKGVRSVSMRIGRGPLVAATLQTTPNENGSLVVEFQLSPDLADICAIELMGPYTPGDLDYEVYDVELKGYVTDRK